MKLKHTLFFALTILAFASCKKDILDTPTVPDESETWKVVIRGSLGEGEEPQTKVYTHPTDKGMYTGETSLWQKDDQIMVYFYTGTTYITSVKFVIDTDGMASIPNVYQTDVNFIRDATDPSNPPLPAAGNYNIIAVHNPSVHLSYQNQARSGTDESVDGLDNLTTSHLSKTDMMTGRGSISAAYPTVSIAFKHEFAMLRFNITNTNPSTNIGASIRLDSVLVRTTNVHNIMTMKNVRFDEASGKLDYDDGQRLDQVAVRHMGTIFSSSKTKSIYMLVANNTLVDPNDSLIIDIITTINNKAYGYKQNDDWEISYKRRFIIPRKDVDFLQTPFEAGKRYVFNVSINHMDPSQDNIIPLNFNPYTPFMIPAPASPPPMWHNLDVNNLTASVTKFPSTMMQHSRMVVVPSILFHDGQYYRFTHIGKGAGYNLNRTIHISHTIKTIGAEGLSSRDTKDIYFHGEIPPDLGHRAIGTDPITWSGWTETPIPDDDLVIHVPRNAAAAYNEVLQNQLKGWTNVLAPGSSYNLTAGSSIRFTMLNGSKITAMVHSIKVIADIDSDFSAGIYGNGGVWTE
jgi:hypothetical protein